jgi:hypothetical protein
LTKNNNKKGRPRPEKAAGRFQVSPLTWVAWIAIIGSMMALVYVNSINPPAEPLSESEFLQKFASNQIAHATINLNPQSGR